MFRVMVTISPDVNWWYGTKMVDMLTVVEGFKIDYCKFIKIQDIL